MSLQVPSAMCESSQCSSFDYFDLISDAFTLTWVEKTVQYFKIWQNWSSGFMKVPGNKFSYYLAQRLYGGSNVLLNNIFLWSFLLLQVPKVILWNLCNSCILKQWIWLLSYYLRASSRNVLQEEDTDVGNSCVLESLVFNLILSHWIFHFNSICLTQTKM